MLQEMLSNNPICFISVKIDNQVQRSSRHPLDGLAQHFVTRLAYRQYRRILSVSLLIERQTNPHSQDRPSAPIQSRAQTIKEFCIAKREAQVSRIFSSTSDCRVRFRAYSFS